MDLSMCIVGTLALRGGAIIMCRGEFQGGINILASQKEDTFGRVKGGGAIFGIPFGEPF
jgi:hypothetical protein